MRLHNYSSLIFIDFQILLYPRFSLLYSIKSLNYFFHPNDIIPFIEFISTFGKFTNFLKA